MRIDDLPSALHPLLKVAKVDFQPRRAPSNLEVLIATVVAITGSLLADAVLVVVGTHLFPSTKGYAHFQFGDYAKLTVIGVVIACLGWPVVVRVSSQPKWLFLRLAVLVTIVLLAPDVYIWHAGQPGQAVGVLMVMHLAIAIVTYASLVILAPVRRSSRRRT